MTGIPEALLVERPGDASAAIVRASLQLKGVPFRRTEATSGWLWRARRSLPSATPPILHCGDRMLVGTVAILDWLEVVAPEPVLRPRDATALGYCRLLEQWTEAALGAAIDGVLWGDPAAAERLSRDAGDDLTPGPLAPLTAWWIRTWRRRIDSAPIPSLPTVLDVLEAMLTGRAYLLGAALTAADLAVYAQLARLDALTTTQPFPCGEAVGAWRLRLDAVDAIRSAVSP